MMAARDGLELYEFDIKAAYLNADLEETICAEPPPGMEKLDENGQPMVWLLLKALYGLKQSGNCWMMLLIKVLKKLGMKQSMADTHVTVVCVVQDGPHDGDLLYTLVRRVNKVLRSIFVKATKPS